MNNPIIFSGHFELGEQLTKQELLSIQAAQKYSGQQAMVVNDIGFVERCLAYHRDGLAGVKELYFQRMVCATTGCTLSQLPAPGDLAMVIDDELFQAVAQQYKLWKASINFEPTKLDIASFFKTQVIPKFIEQRLRDYGLDPKEVKIYSEKQMRNRAELRLRKERSKSEKSWLKLLSQAEQQKSLMALLLPEVKKNSGTPSCRGILLALYEQVALEGFTEIIQLYEQKQYLAIQQASDLYAAIHSSFPNDSRWSAKIQNHYFDDHGEIKNIDLQKLESFSN